MIMLLKEISRNDRYVHSISTFLLRFTIYPFRFEDLEKFEEDRKCAFDDETTETLSKETLFIADESD